VDIIIDAGTSKIGLESTVLDLTTEPPLILRPGGITLKQLKEVSNDIDIDPALMKRPEKDCRPKSPGMKYTHYSPRAEVIIVEGDMEKVAGKIGSLAREYEAGGKKVGILATDQTVNLYSGGELITLGDRDKPETIAAKLFWALRELDGRNVEIILAEGVDYSGIGLAVMNRMNKASGFNIIKV
jgi:L-threonylcarbamoyladenylate synthase